MKRAVLLGVLLACSAPDKTIEYAPYDGPPAYPNQRPKLPPPKGSFAFVSDSLSDTISVLDLPSDELVAQVPVGRDPIDIDGPHHLAVDHEGNVFVALSYPQPTTLPGPHAAHASAVRPGWIQKLAKDDLRVLGEAQLDPNPGEIVLAPDDSKLIVTHFDLRRALEPKLTAEEQRATLMIIDPRTLAIVSLRVCRAPHGASIAPDNHTAYVACYADDALAIVDLNAPNASPQIVPVGSKGPYSAVISPSGALVAIGNTDGKDTRLFDTQSRAMRPDSFVTQGAPYFAAWSSDETKLYIPVQAPDALVVIDPATGTTLKERAFDAATCMKPHEAKLAKDGTTLYVVCEGDHVAPSVVVALDATTLDTKTSVKVGVYPDRLAFTP